MTNENDQIVITKPSRLPVVKIAKESYGFFKLPDDPLDVAISSLGWLWGSHASALLVITSPLWLQVFIITIWIVIVITGVLGVIQGSSEGTDLLWLLACVILGAIVTL